MKSSALALWVLLALALPAEDKPLHAWTFTRGNAEDSTIEATAGPYSAKLAGTHTFQPKDPPCVKLAGKDSRIEISADSKTAQLPKESLTTEAWLSVDRAQEWGGIIGAFQHNGKYQKGWLLGYNNDHFFLALSTGDHLTYLNAQAQFQAGCWYHLVGTYDGKNIRVYVDGRLQAESKDGDQTGPIEYPPRYFYTVGAYRDDNEFYPLSGRIESVAVFDKALSEEQIVARFNAHKNIFPGIDPVRPVVIDWPTDMRDNQRTGITDQELKFPLKLKWQYQARFAPRPAWPEEAKQDYYNRRTPQERVNYDKAFHVTAVKDRLYFSSSADDRVRCLEAATGAERWNYCTEGPVRLAPTIDNDRAYFGSDDGFAYCLNAATGALIWKTRIAPEERQIAGNERIISAWPVRTDIFIENGSGHVCAGIFAEQGVVQTMLDCRDGKILLARPVETTAQGYQRRLFGKLQVGTGRNLAGAFVAELKDEGKELGPLLAPLPFYFCAIGTNTKDNLPAVRITGAENRVVATDSRTHAELWSEAVNGKPWSMAVGGGQLYVSTSTGRIYCYQARGAGVSPADGGILPLISHPAGKWTGPKDNSAVARAIKFVSGQALESKGYCLMLGCDAQFAYEFASRYQWRIVVRDNDAAKLDAARTLIDTAGLSDRVSFQFGGIEKLPYTDYLFNVVVHTGALLGVPAINIPRDEILRVLRPEGGVAFLGLDEKDIERRGALPGAGEWSHQYAGPGNSACSRDELVKGPFQVQWFGPPGPHNMIDRHHRTAAPLVVKGRLFVPGEDHLVGVDAYNGTVLWERHIPGTRRVVVFRDNSYLAANANALFAAAPDKCLKLNPQTGATLHEFPLPSTDNGPHEWDYVALSGDLLIGSATKAGSIRRTQNHQNTVTETHWDFVPIVGSDRLFAYRQEGGEPLWTYAPQSGLIVNPTLCIGGGALYFIESRNPATLTQPQSRARLSDMFAKGGVLTALDLNTGKPLWRKGVAGVESIQHNLYLSHANGAVVMVGTRNDGTNKSLARVVYDIGAFDAKDGTLLWSQSQTQVMGIGGEHGEQDLHPAIVNGTLYCEPQAYELLTGKPVDWGWPWLKSRRGCGTISASNTCFFFRHETMTQFDLASKLAATITSDTRPGCWINLIPAGGLLLAPEASSGCTCNHAVQTSLALIPKR